MPKKQYIILQGHIKVEIRVKWGGEVYVKFRREGVKPLPNCGQIIEYAYINIEIK